MKKPRPDRAERGKEPQRRYPMNAGRGGTKLVMSKIAVVGCARLIIPAKNLIACASVICLDAHRVQASTD
jgi:hypothetical protein